MPKRRQKDAKKGERKSNTLPDDDDQAANAADDNLSVVSNQSSQSTVAESDDTVTVDESGSQEIFVDKLKENIEGISAKSLKERIDSLKNLITALSHKYLVDFLDDRTFTIFDSLERCMRRGKGEDIGYAAHLVSLLFVQSGNTDTMESTYKQIYPTLAAIVSDPSAAPDARCHCADALAVTTFVAASELEQIKTAMSVLEAVFKASYLKGDHSTPIHKPEIVAIHTSALHSWSLLTSVLSANAVDEYVRTHLPKLAELLTSADVELRIAAGETMALLYELARSHDEDFVGKKEDELCAALKELATDSNKYRSKKDRKHQRSSFRDILHTVEDGDVPTFDVRFGDERLSIDSWVQRRQYDMFCHVLGAGINTHLQENEFVREVLGLGPPIPSSALASLKADKAQRHQCNAMAFKIRTRDRAKTRDKRVAAVDSDL